MTQVFELAAFTVRDGHEQALLDERPAMMAAMRRSFPGLVSAWLTQREDGSWLDTILWRSREDAEHSAAHVADVPEAAAWFTHIAEFRGIEHITVRSADASAADDSAEDNSAETTALRRQCDAAVLNLQCGHAG